MFDNNFVQVLVVAPLLDKLHETLPSATSAIHHSVATIVAGSYF